MFDPRTPKVAADCIVEMRDGRVILIKRKFPPLGTAIPGGFIEEGESVEAAAKREIKEELGVDIEIECFLGYYDNPQRDPRFHVISFVFVGYTVQEPKAGDDAKELLIWDPEKEPVPEMIADHAKILEDYLTITNFNLQLDKSALN